MKLVSGNFFKPLPFQTEAIILSRILHDWNDERCTQILQNCHKALLPNRKIYIIENLQDKKETPLLSLNMLLICQNYERNLSEYQSLLDKINFQIQTIVPLNELQSVLICQTQ
ncbi:MAG: methyltransferase [Microscillaceae bacterium]|nr:methyltransferase [Microscillaceae bacterium]MDW8461629.1 methyltransferase [Cytophagales bacterium]